VHAVERAWGERHAVGVVGGGGKVQPGRETGEGPAWKREEAHEPCLEVVGQPGKKGNGPAQETIVPFYVFIKFQIKYACEDIEIRNNFYYWNLSKFDLEFE
jgi:hypothetical protein